MSSGRKASAVCESQVTIALVGMEVNPFFGSQVFPVIYQYFGWNYRYA